MGTAETKVCMTTAQFNQQLTRAEGKGVIAGMCRYAYRDAKGIQVVGNERQSLDVAIRIVEQEYRLTDPHHSAEGKGTGHICDQI